MKTRADIVKDLAPNSIVIELGVAAGCFGVDMFKTNPNIQYIGIDRWSDHHDEAEMYKAINKLKNYAPRVAIMRYSFENALPLFHDEFADLIYIDGYAHTGQDNGKTLDDWYPKLKSGGIFAGHDYCKKYQLTINAVNAFSNKHNLTLNIINDGDHPSWWIFKS